MSIAKKRGERTNTEPLRKKSRNKYVVDETAIGDFIGSLSIYEIDKAAALLQAVADLTGVMLNNPVDEISQSQMQIIKRLANESNNKQYQQIMKAMTDAFKQGRVGIKAGHQTAARAVELAFRWTLEYFAAFDLYREKLRRMSEESQNSQPVIND